MTNEQLLTLVGSLMQAGALVWAWIALYRVWRLRWPDQPIIPWLSRAWKAVGSRAKTWWARLTGRTAPATVPAPSMTMTGRMGVPKFMASERERTLKERIDLLEDQFYRVQDIYRQAFWDLGISIDQKVGAIAEEHRRDRDRAVELERRAARFNLAGPALLALAGIVPQVWAVFA